MELPSAFRERMQSLLREEYPDFVASYEEARSFGLRVNTLKLSPDRFREIAPFALEPVPWAREGFYYQEEAEPGKHPYHDAGLYYIQEPSAMAVGTLLDPQPGELVLDLAAAPGGKSTHLATKMQGQGLLIANEINSSRAKILSQNIERLGISNCLVTNESPDRLAQRFPHVFHRVLVDAPCSGEGMFRKDPAACSQWSPEHVAGCAIRQANILASAAQMLRPGGVLAYSTCTFAQEEDEVVIASFLQTHPGFTLLEAPTYPGFAPGLGLPQTVRLWPHRARGEGHYIALLRNEAGEAEDLALTRSRPNQESIRAWQEFAVQNLKDSFGGEYASFGENLYLLPTPCPDLAGLKILRAGLQLGTVRKGRFTPSHALALALAGNQPVRSMNLSSQSTEIGAYLRGETLTIDGDPGWTLVTVDGYTLGWGKVSTGVLKNHYPKGLRRTL